MIGLLFSSVVPCVQVPAGCEEASEKGITYAPGAQSDVYVKGWKGQGRGPSANFTRDSSGFWMPGNLPLSGCHATTVTSALGIAQSQTLVA